MSELTTIARPYAKAAFDFAVENKSIDQWQNMLDFATQVVENKTIQQFLRGDSSVHKTADTVIAICGDKLNEQGRNFIKLMAENQRLTALPAVFQQFLSYVAEHQATADVDVISAQPLSDVQIKKIQQAMERKLDKKVKLHCTVDSTLIAGVIIRAGDMVIDGSSRGQLTRLANELQL
ncbi:F-type H+-transporting ATPase subunit delta [Cricetibacter osteomyelitidis]|uniref:ATP synthase subunit delta n=1 Tax=Cricetibacter osteomyelitidis TaxID=1521931 RepID=A0A4R2T724_9PAST|nr:F0F1 ATP synthase subunit delta [Cricetibacter osteomyelitidis]TCP97296.1 F-type H+-transporting ATPase subunit delta [Cricetibacter osteomyelitidis]